MEIETANEDSPPRGIIPKCRMCKEDQKCQVCQRQVISNLEAQIRVFQDFFRDQHALLIENRNEIAHLKNKLHVAELEQKTAKERYADLLMTGSHLAGILVRRTDEAKQLREENNFLRAVLNHPMPIPNAPVQFLISSGFVTLPVNPVAPSQNFAHVIPTFPIYQAPIQGVALTPSHANNT